MITPAVFIGAPLSYKQFKFYPPKVKEVAANYECGISIENFNDIKVGDFIESYIVEEKDK